MNEKLPSFGRECEDVESWLYCIVKEGRKEESLASEREIKKIKGNREKSERVNGNTY